MKTPRNRSWSHALFGTALSALLCLPQMGWGQNDTPPPPTEPPPATTESGSNAGPSSNMQDPIFDQYVDLELLGQAWRSRNAELLTDLAFQFAEGERVLRRPHKVVKASVVLDSAIKLAIDADDKESLSRLAKAAEQSGDKDRAAQLAAALKTTGVSRAFDPVLGEGTQEAMNVIMNVNERLAAIRFGGSEEDLVALDKSLDDQAGPSAKQKEALKKMIAEARGSLPEQRDAEAIENAATLDKLAGSSRVNLNPLSPEYLGTWRWAQIPNCMYRENFLVIDYEIWVAYWNGSKWTNLHLVPRDSVEWAKVMYGLTSKNAGWRTIKKGADPKITVDVYIDSGNPNWVYGGGKWKLISNILKSGLVGQDGASIVAAGGGNFIGTGVGSLIQVTGGESIAIDRGFLNLKYLQATSSAVSWIYKK